MTGQARKHFWMFGLALALLVLVGVFVEQQCGALGIFAPSPSRLKTLLQPEAVSDGVLEVRKSNTKCKLLFVGNSHTGFHQLSNLVKALMDDRLQNGDCLGRYVPVTFLDSNTESVMRQIESEQWDAVILQAQKISSSGKYMYSTDAGVEIAKYAISHDCKPFFFAEWGIENVPNHTRFTETIYQSMADEAGCELIPVGRVWESVLAEAPETNLYSDDHNHQSRLGASLTALTIASYLLNEPATCFASFNDQATNTVQWQLFVRNVAKVQTEYAPKGSLRRAIEPKVQAPIQPPTDQ